MDVSSTPGDVTKVNSSSSITDAIGSVLYEGGVVELSLYLKSSPGLKNLLNNESVPVTTAVSDDKPQVPEPADTPATEGVVILNDPADVVAIETALPLFALTTESATLK